MKKKRFDIHAVVAVLRRMVPTFREPAVTQVARKRDPFQVLISCVISLRTKDEVTAEASRRLFVRAQTPQSMLKLSQDEIAALIYPAGFYRQKAGQILGISDMLIGNYNGVVPDSIDELLKLPGVGRKTANLVVTMGYGQPGICVDTHVHRISNRWGYVQTKTPDETEQALRQKLPSEYWIEINDLLVTYGQNVCAPISPKCSLCTIVEMCKQIGVDKKR